MTALAPFFTRRSDHVDNLHGQLVADPYSWLEDTYSPETTAWVEAQNARTEAFLDRLPHRQEITAQLSDLWDYARADAPFQRGGRWFQWRNSGLQDQAVLYVMGSPGDAGRALLDPNCMSDDGTVAVTDASASDDGTLLAYATSEAGSDWKTWRVRDVTTGTDLPDVVEWAKYSGAAWRKDGSGFYYLSVTRPQPGEEHTAKTGLHRAAFHALGTPSSQDEIVFERPDQPEWEPWAEVSDDGRYLVITLSKGTAPETRIEVLDLEAGGSQAVVLQPDFPCLSYIVANSGSTFFLLTEDQAQHRRVVAAELEHPGRQHWRQVVPEQGAVLNAAVNCGGKLVCHYLEDACSQLCVYELDGTLAHVVALPELSSVDNQIGRDFAVQGRPESALLHFGVQSFTGPGSIWSHDVVTGKTSMLQSSQASFDATGLVTERAFVVASDGARVPLFLTRQRGTVPTGDARVLLYGYGGFNIPITPSFGRADALFVQRGGVLAVACVRGGGEYGRPWHDAGRLANKQRVFDDFCDCARWLVTSGWSRPSRIGINGGSNGGLLVGACLTQHPELFGAAVPEVGVLDMLRFHKFTIGWAWKSDFGDPDDAQDFEVLRAYSPLHNIKDGTRYPPVLVTTGDHDDRVVPGHSFKFTAALQAAQAAQAGQAGQADDGSTRPPDVSPVLIRVETSAGHGQGKPTSKSIAERADVLTFLEWALSRETGA